MKRRLLVTISLTIGLACGSLTTFAESTPAIPELEQKAAAGDAEAQFQLARALLRGTGVAKDFARSFELMKRAAEAGHAEAMGGLGYFYASGLVVAKDPVVGVEWLRKAVAKGSDKAKLNLGLILARGTGVPPNENEGLRLIDEAAASGLPEALYARGETYYWGQFGRAVDYQKALPLFREAAEKGHVDSQNNYGAILLHGLAGEKNEALAIEWFRKAAEAGHARAQSNLGHAIGTWVPDRKKRIEAIMWLKLAADRQEITAVKTIEELWPELPAADQNDVLQAVEDFLTRHAG